MSRAATNAVRLPTVPPCMNTPAALSGIPASLASHAECLVLRKHGTGPLQPTPAIQAARPDHQIEHGRRLGRGGRDEGEGYRLGWSTLMQALDSTSSRSSAFAPPSPSAVMVSPTAACNSSAVIGCPSGTGSNRSRISA